MNQLTIRLETPPDHLKVAEVTTAAFGQKEEADLVQALREEGAVRLSLVAELEGEVVGHILFSDLTIAEDGGEVDGVALAPMAVSPDHQKSGIGRALIAEGIAICQTLGVEAIIVLGHKEYYPRFGFSAQLAAKLTSPFPDAGDAFMALELKEGSLDNGGKIHYAKAFGL